MVHHTNHVNGNALLYNNRLSTRVMPRRKAVEDAPPLTYTRRPVCGITGRIDTRPSSMLGSTQPYSHIYETCLRASACARRQDGRVRSNECDHPTWVRVRLRVRARGRGPLWRHRGSTGADKQRAPHLGVPDELVPTSVYRHGPSPASNGPRRSTAAQQPPAERAVLGFRARASVHAARAAGACGHSASHQLATPLLRAQVE